MQANLRFAAAIARNHADDIEAAGRRPVTGQATDILPSDGQDVPLLVPIHRSRGRREIGTRPRFDLDKTQNSIIPADQVNLAAVVRNTEVRGHDSVAEGAQMEVRLNFAVLAG